MSLVNARPHVRQFVDVVKTAVAVVKDRQLTFVAGALAYAAFLSLLPLLVLFLGVAAMVRGEGITGPMLGILETQVSPAVADVFRASLERERGLLGASLLSVVVFVWSGMRVFRGLNVAFGTIYGEREESFVATVRDGVLSMTCLAIAIVLLVGVEGVLVASVHSAILEVVGPLLLFVGLVVALLPVYYVLPDVPVTVREAFPGAAVTAVGWILLGSLFQLYVAATGKASGVLGGIVLLLTLLYLAMLLFLVGAVVNAVLGGRESAGPSAALAAVG